MREGNKKEKWDKPKLIILTRGRPEEVVLQACKAADESGSSTTTYQLCWDYGWNAEIGEDSCLGSCESISSS